MPNRKYQEQVLINDFNPYNWKNLDEERQIVIGRNFENTLIIDNERRVILKNFWPDNWKQLNRKQKIDTCQKLEYNLSFDYNRNPYKVLPLDSGVMYDNSIVDKKKIEGNTDYYSNTIKLNFDKFIDNPYAILRIFLHESCHADQYHLIRLREEGKSNSKYKNIYNKRLRESGLSDKDILIIHWEAQHYSPASDKTNILHDMQFMEVDAELESISFLKNYSEYMGNTREYFEFIEKEEENLNRVNGYFEKKELVKEWMKDRKKRVKNTDKTVFDSQDIEELKTFYSSENLKVIGSKLLAHLESWSKHKKIEVEIVSYAELNDKIRIKPETYTNYLEENKIVKNKKLIFGLKSTRL